MADYGRFAPAQISFGGIEKAVDSFEQGGVYGRQRKLRNILGTPEAKALLEKQDFGGLASLVASVDPGYAQKLLNEGSTGGLKYGLNPVQIYNPRTKQMELWQPNNAGLPPTRLEFGGGVPTVQQRYLEGPEGYGGYPARGPYTPVGPGQPQPQPQPQLAPGQPDFEQAQPPVPLTSQMDAGQPPQEGVGPDIQPSGPGQVAPAAGPNQFPVYSSPEAAAAGGATPGRAIPSLGATKFNREVRIAQQNDINTINVMDEQIRLLESNMSELLTKEGGPAPGLKAIAGTWKPGLGIEIPKDLAPNWREQSANTAAALETYAVEIGLKALSDMRAQSAQGASGMGQLAIKESEWLQRSVKNLQTAQSPEKVAENARLVLYHAKRVRDILHQGYQQLYGQGAMPTNIPPPAAGAGETPPSAAGQRKVYDINGNPL